MSATASATRDAELRTWASSFERVTPIAALRARTPACVVGVVQRIRLVPGESVEVTVEDGTGRLEAVWTGRQSLPGLELGRALRLRGTVCGDRDVPLLRNPSWCLIADPYACRGRTGKRGPRRREAGQA